MNYRKKNLRVAFYYISQTIIIIIARLKFCVKGKEIPLQAWTGPEGSRRVKAPRFQDNRHMKIVRSSALRTGRLYPPGNIPGTHFC